MADLIDSSKATVEREDGLKGGEPKLTYRNGVQEATSAKTCQIKLQR